MLNQVDILLQGVAKLESTLRGARQHATMLLYNIHRIHTTTKCCCNTGYLSEMRPNLKSCEISFAQYQSGRSPNVVALFLLQTLVAIWYDFFNCMIQLKWNQIIHESTIITFYRIISGECAVPGLNATFCFLWFTNCVLLFDKSLILGCLWPLVFVLNNILILGIWISTIPHLPGCFGPWTFFENIGFNTVLTDPFMSHLATQLGYSAGEFQALQLIVLAAFGVVD